MKRSAGKGWFSGMHARTLSVRELGAPAAGGCGEDGVAVRPVDPTGGRR